MVAELESAKKRKLAAVTAARLMARRAWLSRCGRRIVEWKDLPGEYYALAVWGGDRAAVMEFVD